MQREGIKAIGKKEYMIEQLLKKLPKGVPPCVSFLKTSV